MTKLDFNNNTYFAIPKDNPKDKISVEIGDSKEPDIILPQEKICRWDNESNVSIRLLDFDEYSVFQDKDKIIFGNEKLEAHFYPITEGEGGQELEVILKEKPITNKIEFFLVDKDVDYFYQPELTQKEIDQGTSRPENVVGSYAVYAKSNKVNYVDSKEYKCGKVGHIYRPKIIDAEGTEVWGELLIKNGILSVTIPQEFLDKAVYPVRIDPTFGYDSIGVSNNQLAWTNFSSFTSYRQGYYDYINNVPSQSGTLDKITIALVAQLASESIDVSVFLNTHDSGGTGIHNQIATIERTNLSITTTAAWFDFTAASEEITPSKYILSASANPDDITTIYDTINVRYDAIENYYDFSEAWQTGNEYIDSKESPWTKTEYSDWQILTGYEIEDIKKHNGKYYECIAQHTSSSDDEPGIGQNWEDYWEQYLGRKNSIYATYTAIPTANSERAAKITGELGDIYNKAHEVNLPTTDADLDINYQADEITDVGTSDDQRVIQKGQVAGYILHQWKKLNDNNTDQINATIELQVTRSPSAATVYLQIYNYDLAAWENLDSDNSSAANTDFILTGSISTNIANYYDANNFVTLRVYQQIE